MQSEPLLRAAALALLTLILLAAPPAARATDHVLLIGGQGGEARYTEQFAKDLTRLRDQLTGRCGYDDRHVRLLAERPTTQTATRIDAEATTATIRRELTRLAGEMKTSDTLLLVLIGHGQSDYVEPKFNLPGPDLTAAELDGLLSALPPSDQRLVLAFGCSGHFAQLLAKPGRCIIASGDGPRQIYDSILPEFLIKDLDRPAPAATDAGGGADLDQDGRISLWELFQTLSGQVTGDYARRSLLQTENTALEDNGDGDVTTLAEGMDAGDGTRARQTWLVPAPAGLAEHSTAPASAEATTTTTTTASAGERQP